MPKITKELWNSILIRKVDKVLAERKAQKEKAIPAFEKDNKTVYKQLTVLSHKKAVLESQVENIRKDTRDLEINLKHKAIRAGLLNKSGCRCGGYSCSGEDRVNHKSFKGPIDVQSYQMEFPTSPGYGPHNYARVEDFLTSTDDPIFVKLYRDFQDLQLQVELAENEDAQGLIKAFLK